MKCELCGKSPDIDGVNLKRMNELGIKGIWRCWDCLTDEEYQEIDQVTLDIDEVVLEDEIVLNIKRLIKTKESKPDE